MKNFGRLSLSALLTLSLTSSLGAQQPEPEKPWWPHSIWGSGDQAGGSNWITPAKVLEAVQLVSSGKIYELGQVYEAGMPIYGTRSYSMLTPAWEGEPALGSNQLLGHEEFLCTQIGQVGTQFDGPGHIGKQILGAGGEIEQRFYNGFQEEQIRGSNGLRALGVENVKPILTRGILIDIAAARGVKVLDPSYEVTLADVRNALERQGFDESSFQPGDAIFFRYGWSSHWTNPDVYNPNPPGIGLEVARWIVSKQPSMVGSDSWTTEVVPNPNPNLFFPVHQELIMKNGIFNLENMTFESLLADKVYEFLFILTPIPFKGASGSPARPIAIR